MKILIGLILIKTFLINEVVSEDDWGATGHRVVGKIAAQHISNKTQRIIDELLDGATLDYVSNYADDIKSDKRFRSYGPWHYVNIESEASYTEVVPNKKGDVLQAIKKCIAVLKDPKASREDKQFHL